MTKGLLTCRSQGRVCILDAWCSYLGGSNCSLKMLNKADVQSSHPVKEDSGRHHVLSVSGWLLCPPSSLALFLSKQVPPNFFLPSYWRINSLLTVRAACLHSAQKGYSTDPVCVWESTFPEIPALWLHHHPWNTSTISWSFLTIPQTARSKNVKWKNHFPPSWREICCLIEPFPWP